MDSLNVNCVFLFQGAARKIRNARDRAAGIVNRRSRSQGPLTDQKRSITISTSEHGPIDFTNINPKNYTQSHKETAYLSSSSHQNKIAVKTNNITSAPTYGVDLISSNFPSNDNKSIYPTSIEKSSTIPVSSTDQISHRPSVVIDHIKR